MNKSILFVIPDYHCSFFYRDALRKRGWKADIYLPNNYPKKLLYTDNVIIIKNVVKIFKPFYHFFVFCIWLFKYKYFFIYGGHRLLPLLPVFVENLFGKNFYLDLFLLKFLNKKLIYLPSGCIDIDLKKEISKIDDGNICNNCGWDDSVCKDESNIKKFNILNKYFDLFLGFPDMESTQYKQITYKYKSIDLYLWKPDIRIPDKFKLPKTKNLRILHSFFKENRENNGKNIKGSPFIVDAIDILKEEGFEVEYFYVIDVESKNMRYYQAQADIVVEQLIYGWWGSTGVETMALGKPVICYLREDAKDNFYKNFPEYNSLPIIEANVLNIYEVLKKTVMDNEFREKKAKESRLFAESFFDIEKNVIEFEKILLEL
ncbi:glycosyltransferase [Sulfurospirillum arcachonense]|uniref:glycosyltransferase n=1 Tax=Sulfurospirillum arcachonense TaxID=57666 RepID=UPI00046AE4DD|nr:glycosyltransferase [Sulfurospirillum arcachonense]